MAAQIMADKIVEISDADMEQRRVMTELAEDETEVAVMRFAERADGGGFRMRCMFSKIVDMGNPTKVQQLVLNLRTLINDLDPLHHAGTVVHKPKGE